MMDNFIIILISILLEALPFMLAGAIISGFMEVFIPSSLIMRIMPKNPVAAVFIGAGSGIALPMCECGSVIIVRRLIKKGMPASAAIAYMLAAPIINPITLLSTYAAYAWFKEMVLLRAAFGIGVAVISGIAVSLFFKKNFLKKTDELQIINKQEHEPGGKLGHAVRHAIDDFMIIFSMLLIGASVVALFKTFAHLSLYEFFRSEGWLGIPLFSGLAVIFSLCSEADAFVAAAMNGIFDIPAQLAFLAVGPILDIKLILLYHSIFTRRMLIFLCTLPLLIVITAAFMLRGIILL